MTPDSPTFAFPDERQISAANSNFPVSPLATRGHFKPWAVLKPPASTRAFRFVYPTLIAATSKCLFVWDIPTGELVQSIQNTHISPDGVGSNLTLGLILYVEVSARLDGHAFICGSNTLRIFSRASGRCVLDLPSSRLSYGKNTYCFAADGSHQQGWLPNSVLKPQPTIHRVVVLPSNDNRRLLDEFIAGLSL